jgi:hypothetical protein
MEEQTGFPKSDEFLRMATHAEQACQAESEEKVSQEDHLVLAEIGTVLSYIYRFSTCFWGCRRQGHALESQSGRVFTLSRSAICLIQFGYYDEAFALIRSIGELANLLYLFMLKPEARTEWYSISEEARRRHFSPASVRKAIEKIDPGVPIDANHYKWLCEVGVHVNPDTAPQVHNEEKQPHLGAYFQREGYSKAVATLGWALFIAFGVIAKNANVEDAYKSQMHEAWTKLAKALEGHPHLSSS